MAEAQSGKIAVLGLGNFGTALAKTWLDAGNEVVGWTIEEDVHNDIEAHGRNSKYLADVDLTGLGVTMRIDTAIEGAAIVVMALPSGVVLQVFEQLLEHLVAGQTLLDLAKGLAPDDRLLSDVMEERLAECNLENPLCVMMGPTIAPELARGVFTVALVASRHRDVADAMAVRLTTGNLKLSSAADPVGAELWGAFKNVIALGCGISDGLAEGGLGGDNLKAAIFTRGYAEACRVLPLLGADPQTAQTAAGIGDLFVTATSPHGRNRSLGERLGRGETLEAAQAQSVMVSEGVRATRMFSRQFTEKGIDAPFVAALNGLLEGDLSVEAFLAGVAG